MVKSIIVSTRLLLTSFQIMVYGGCVGVQRLDTPTIISLR